MLLDMLFLGLLPLTDLVARPCAVAEMEARGRCTPHHPPSRTLLAENLAHQTKPGRTLLTDLAHQRKPGRTLLSDEDRQRPRHAIHLILPLLLPSFPLPIHGAGTA